MAKEGDLWETPQWLFEQLDKEFNFDVDLCANKSNTKCEFWANDMFSDHFIECLLLNKPHCAFMNPPYSKPKPFIETAISFASVGVKVVSLLKVDPSTSWWALFWDYSKHAPKENVQVRFLPKRLKFEKKGVPYMTANFPSCIVIFDKNLKIN